MDLATAARESGNDRCQLVGINPLGRWTWNPADSAKCASSFSTYAVNATAGTVSHITPIVPQLPNQVEAVLVRHADVTDLDVGAPVGKCIDRCPGAVRRRDNSADAFQHQRQDLAGISLVIHHEYMYTIETDRRTLCIVNGTGRFNLALAVRPRFVVPFRSNPHGWYGQTNGERQSRDLPLRWRLQSSLRALRRCT